MIAGGRSQFSAKDLAKWLNTADRKALESLPHFVGAENVIPPINAEAEIMMPHIMFVVNVVDGHFHPKAFGGVFMLQLVCIGGKCGVGESAEEPPKAGF